MVTEAAGVLSQFLMEYKLCPVSWIDEPDWKQACKRAEELLRELMGKPIKAVGYEMEEDVNYHERGSVRNFRRNLTIMRCLQESMYSKIRY